MTTTAVLYLRLSKDSTASDSLEGQEADCRRRAAELGATDVVIFRETVSGYRRNVKRKAFDAMKKYVREHRPALLIAWKFDRFSRQGIQDVAAASTLVNETGVRFLCLQDNLDSANDEWEMMAAFAARQANGESRNTSIRVAARQARDRAKGRWTKERPFGYLVTKDRKLMPHPVEADVVRGMVAEFLSPGGSLKGIAQRLTAEQVPTLRYAKRAERLKELRAAGRDDEAAALEARPLKSRNTWGLTTVRHILASPVLAGFMVHKGAILLDDHGEPVRVSESPLITVADHRRILAKLEERASVVKTGKRAGHRASPGRPPTFLLAGFLRCGECGAALVGNRRKPPRISRYRCVGKAHGHPCTAGSIPSASAERAVIDMTLGHLAVLEPDDPALAAVAEKWLAKHAPEHTAERTELAERAESLRARLEDLEEARWIRGEFTDSEGAKRYERFRSRITEQLAAVENALATLPEPEIDVSALLDPVETAHTFASDDPATLAERREVLSLVLEQVKVFPNGRLEPVWVGSTAEHVPVPEPLTA